MKRSYIESQGITTHRANTNNTRYLCRTNDRLTQRRRHRPPIYAAIIEYIYICHGNIIALECVLSDAYNVFKSALTELLTKRIN